MILADTSIWVAHLKTKGGHRELIAALEGGDVASHPFVEGELLLAGAPTDQILAGVEMLPVEPHAEVADFFRTLSKPVRGIGWVDAHLIFSALLHTRHLLTLDRPQAELFQQLIRA